MKNPGAEEFNGPDIVLHRTKPGPLVATPQTVGQIFRQTFRKDDKYTLHIFFYLLSSITGASEQSMFVILDLYLIQWLIFRVHTTLAVGIYFLSGSTYFYFVYMDGSYFFPCITMISYTITTLHYGSFVAVLYLALSFVIYSTGDSTTSATRLVSGIGNSDTV